MIRCNVVPNSLKLQVQFRSTSGKLQIDDASVSVEAGIINGLVPLPESPNGRSGS